MKQFSIVTVLLALVILPGAQKVTPLQQQQDQPMLSSNQPLLTSVGPNSNRSL
jgi:hypothetical protein